MACPPCLRAPRHSRPYGRTTIPGRVVASEPGAMQAGTHCRRSGLTIRRSVHGSARDPLPAACPGLSRRARGLARAAGARASDRGAARHGAAVASDTGRAERRSRYRLADRARTHRRASRCSPGIASPTRSGTCGCSASSRRCWPRATRGRTEERHDRPRNRRARARLFLEWTRPRRRVTRLGAGALRHRTRARRRRRAPARAAPARRPRARSPGGRRRSPAPAQATSTTSPCRRQTTRSSPS